MSVPLRLWRARRSWALPGRVLATGLFLLPPALLAQTEPAPRAPRGIYALVNIEENITNQENANPSITPAQLESYFIGLYQQLLANPAVAGVVIYENWSTLNPNSPPAANAFDWSYLDDAFTQASAWSSQNPSQAPKTIQLVVSPGFQTPAWVLSQISSCDPLFNEETPPAGCGKATFSGFVEGGGIRELPLPWNPFYQSSWQAFLTVLAARYGSNPLFVSIAVAGPTASSEEMILPDNANSDNPQTQFDFNVAPNQMWIQLLALQFPGMASYLKSDQAFIDEWEAAIDMYGQIFSGLTLVVTTGSGLPNLSTTGFTVPSAFTADCPNPDMDCAAETTILSYFLQSTVGGPNGKAVQEDGMEAARGGVFNLGLAGIRLVSQMTAPYTTPSTQVLGGSQFSKSFVNFTLQEGCTAAFPPNASDPQTGCNIAYSCTVQACIPVECVPQACLAPGYTQADLDNYTTFGQVLSQDPMVLIPPEQAEYNVLSWYFTGTAVAASFGATAGPAPLNYLQIYSPDILYATANANAPAQVVETGGATASLTAQQLLNMANQALAQISELPLSVPPAGLSITSAHTGSFTQGQNGAVYTLTVANAASGSATSGTVTVTDTIPTGLSLVAMSGTGWNCSSNACFRGDALSAGASYPAIAVVVNVADNAPLEVTNQASVSGGGSPGATTSDPTAIAAGQPPAAVTTFSPAQGATGVSPNASLTWGAAGGAASYNVYLGMSNPPPLASTGVAGVSYTPASMNPGTAYYWSVTAVNAFGTTPSAVWQFTTGAQSTSGLRFVPVTPCRVMDTRNAAGPFGGPAIAGGTTRNVSIPQSACSIPATAQAYSLNITVVPPGPLTYLSIWPAGEAQPVVSTLNSYDGRIVANAAIVPAGTGGAISVYVSNTTEVIIDIDGYFASASTSGSMSFYTATPCRVVDTRNAAGTFGGPFMSGGSTRGFPIPASACGIPAAAQAYSLNVTVVPHGPLEYLTIWPTGESQPLVSTLNAVEGSIVANAAIVPAGTSGEVSVFVTGDTDVILDIDGYFAPPGSAGALSLYTLTPCRVVDTRNAAGIFGGPALPAGGTRSFAIPSSVCAVPSTAQAYSLNVTVVPPGPLTYLTAWPSGQSQPVVSTLNSPLGTVVANAALVPSGSSGAVSIFVSNATDVILDINAYFAP